ncbi:MAG: hypothetical protein JST84_22075 [Acidobacteria bacterium]|nr:hypothetical protein [Acidobacteriota bacterium]
MSNKPIQPISELKELSKDLKTPSKSDLGLELELYTKQIDSLAEVLPATMLLVSHVNSDVRKKLREFEESFCKIEAMEGEEKRILVPMDHVGQYRKLLDRRTKSSHALKLIPTTFVVSLVSQYDAFLGRILRSLYLLKPELLNSSERSVTLEQLLEFDSIESAKDYILEKEIENFLRQSHSEQFESLERKFKVELRKELHIWPTFIEITERRNLFVHTSGVISNQYLSVCNKHRVSLGKDAKAGEQLYVEPEYFKTAYECLFEIGVKLAHVLWRKVLPEEREEADDSLNTICYDLLTEGKNKLACKLLDFALETIKKHSNDQARRMFIVNRAQAYKWDGEQEKASEIMSKEDWTAASDNFRLADAIIRDDYEQAYKIINRIGASGSMRKMFYRDWPLFKDLRKQERFHEIFECLFNEPLNIVTEHTETDKEEINSTEDSEMIM